MSKRLSEGTDTGIRIKVQKTYGGVWKRGDALFWRSSGGVHCFIQTKEPERGPRGGLRGPGETASIDARSLAALNRALGELGFSRSRLRLSDINFAG